MATAMSRSWWAVAGVTAEIGGTTVALGTISCAGTQMILSAAGSETVFVVERDGNLVQITRNGMAISAAIELKIDLPRAPGTNDRGGNVIDAPLHGVVSQVFVAVGDEVEQGSAILQMEAMKLIHTLAAPVSGRVAAIHCSAGDTVPAGAVLVEIAPPDEEEIV